LGKNEKYAKNVNILLKFIFLALKMFFQGLRRINLLFFLNLSNQNHRTNHP